MGKGRGVSVRGFREQRNIERGRKRRGKE